MVPNEVLDKLAKLTEREQEVLRLRCQGLKYVAIASRLNPPTNPKTIKSHMHHIYAKLDLAEGLSVSERWTKIFKVFCPALNQKPMPPFKPGTGERGLIPISLAIMKLVDEDEELDPTEPPTDITTVPPRRPPSLPPTGAQPPERPRRVILARVVLVFVSGLVLGLLLGVFLVMRLGTFENEPETTAVAQVTVASTAIVVTREVTVVVPASPPPATATIQPSDTPPAPTDTPPPTPTPTAAVALPFQDNFDNGTRPEWQELVVKGEWRTVEQAYTVTNAINTWVFSLVGDPTWVNYTIEFDYELGNGTLAALVRVSGPKDLGLAFIVGYYETMWSVWDNGDWRRITMDNRDCPATGHVRVEVTGNSFSGTCDGQFYLTMTDDTTASGYVGLGVSCARDIDCPRFDNFAVK